MSLLVCCSKQNNNNNKTTILLLSVAILSLLKSCSDQQVQGTVQKQGSLSPTIHRPPCNKRHVIDGPVPIDRTKWRRRAGTVPTLLHHGQIRPNGTPQTTGLSATITLHHHLTRDPPLTPTPPPTTSSAPPPPPTESTSRHRASLCVSLPSVSLSLPCLSFPVSFCLSLTVCLSLTPTPIISLCLSLPLSVCLSLTVCLSLPLSVFFSPSLFVFPLLTDWFSPSLSFPPVCLALPLSVFPSLTVYLSPSRSFPY